MLNCINIIIEKGSNLFESFFLKINFKNLLFLTNLTKRLVVFNNKENSFMNKIKCTLLIFIFTITTFYGQNTKRETSIGFHYGFGNEIKNSNYTYTNHYYKAQLCYLVKETNHFKYELVLQPELNFATHQLLNLYFVTPEESNYIEKREKFTKLKDIKEYALGIGLCVRKPISKIASVYVLASIGPMITDTETERLSKGFAFSDVLALGFSLKVDKVLFDIRPSLRHISNAQLQSSNAGFNTKNIEFGLSLIL